MHDCVNQLFIECMHAIQNTFTFSFLDPSWWSSWRSWWVSHWNLGLKISLSHFPDNCETLESAFLFAYCLGGGGGGGGVGMQRIFCRFEKWWSSRTSQDWIWLDVDSPVSCMHMVNVMCSRNVPLWFLIKKGLITLPKTFLISLVWP